MFTTCSCSFHYPLGTAPKQSFLVWQAVNICFAGSSVHFHNGWFYSMEARTSILTMGSETFYMQPSDPALITATEKLQEIDVFPPPESVTKPSPQYPGEILRTSRPDTAGKRCGTVVARG